VHDYPDGLVTALLALNRLMVNEEPLETTLARVAEIAAKSIETCVGAGVTLSRNDRPYTVAHWGSIADQLDGTQYAENDGPCLTAYRERHIVQLDVITEHGERWPTFVSLAAELGVDSSLSLPLVVGDVCLGALNLYGQHEQAFNASDRALAELFAAQAAVALANAEVYWQTYALTQTLQIAVESRDVIGQAKGILMALHKISAEEAFALLRRTSQEQNTKLRDIAEWLVRTGELPAMPDRR